jgi:peptide/nickel transport system substrate-binding protein
MRPHLGSLAGHVEARTNGLPIWGGERAVRLAWSRVVTAALLIVAIMSGAASAGWAAESPVRGGVLHVAIAAEPSTLDWMTTTVYACREIAWNFFEPLYTIDATYRVVPMLADGSPHVSGDGKTVTISIRRGVKFHDGSTMTADDVVASLTRWGRLAGAGKAAFRYVRTVKAVDPQTVQITLSAAFAPLLNDMADVSSALFVIPAKIARDAGDKPLTKDELIGTGPYRFDSWQPGQTVKIRRFDGYSARADSASGLGGRKTAYIDEIDFDLVKDPQVRLSGLQTGQYDYVQALSEDALAQVKMLANAKPDVIDPYAWMALVPNKANGPLANVKLRQAISLAVERATAAKGSFGPDDFWYLDGSMFFPEQRGLYATTGTQAYTQHSVDRAKQLVKESGYAGQPILYMTTKDYAWMYDFAQVIVPELEAIGLKIDLETYDWPTILTKRNVKTGWDLFATGFNIALDPSAMIWMNPLWAGSYQSPEMQKLLALWGRTTAPAGKRRLIAQMQQTVYREFPIIKITNYKQLNAYGTKLHGYTPYMDFRFWNTWLGPA